MADPQPSAPQAEDPEAELSLFAPEAAGPYGLPPFDAVPAARYPALFRAAIAAHRDEIDAIARDPAAPDFANTIEALERSGRTLGRLAAAFFTLASCRSDDAVRAAEREIAPLLAGHGARTWTDAALFARVDAIVEGDEPQRLDPEARRVLELHHERFVRSGARLDAEGRARMTEIVEELADLGARFSQNVLADEAGWTLPLGPEDLEGLPEDFRAAARRAAADRGLEGHVVTLSRSSVEPFLALSPRRDLREKAFRAWASRGEGRGAGGPEADNRPLIARILALRAERARLLGFDDFASFKLAPQMAKTPEAVRDLLMRVWSPAKAQAEAEAARLSALAAEEGANEDLAPWDWRHLDEKLRRRKGGLDGEAVKAHLELNAVTGAAFDVAARLFGLSFREVEGLPLHHPDARAWEAWRGDRFMGLFVADHFARPSKRSGAWMSALQAQENFDPAVGEVRPVVINVMNFARGEDETLLSWDDARTLFHEFGHALHGLLSEVRHPYVSGTSVARDFVELPSQLFERWLDLPEVLERHARHHRTGEPMPEEMIAGLAKSEREGQGFATVEYLASAIADLDLHADPAAAEAPEAAAARTLASLGMPAGIAARHAPPHFLHVFSGDGYSAGYYSYMWSEVMDADAFGAFEEAGDAFDPATAERLRAAIYAAGNAADPAEAWRAFRGRDPDPSALLERRGLSAAA